MTGGSPEPANPEAVLEVAEFREVGALADGHALVQQVLVPGSLELTAAAITLEPEGGSAQPTTPIILVGSFAPAKS